MRWFASQAHSVTNWHGIQFSAGDEASLDQAADSLTKMQFYRKLQEEAMELELALEDELAG